jgi:putative transposase
MRTVHSTLTASDVHGYALGLLCRRVRLRDYGPRVTAAAVYAVLLFAAATLATIAAACRRLRKAPCDQSVYDALDATLPGRLELQRRINLALRDCLPKAVRRGKRPAKVAVDVNLVPYYGEPDPDDDMVYRGQQKASTHHHHAFATAYLVREGRRFTLAMMMVRHDTPWDEVVKSLLRLARKAVPAIGLVLVDRGFYSVAVVRYLQRARYPFIMPLMGRGRKDDHPEGPSGSNAFFGWKKSGWGRYRLSQHNYTGTASFDVAVSVRRQPPPRRPGGKRRRGRVWVYACWGVRGRSAEWVSETYRRRRIDWLRQAYRGRFGIETSYRQMNQGRAWTTSTKPARRLLLVGLALLLRNVWALLHLEALALRRRGCRQVRLHLLPLQDMLGWIAEAIKQALGFRCEIETEHAFIL